MKIGVDKLARIWYYILERRIEHENSNHAECSGSLDGRRAAHRVSHRRRASGMVEGKQLRKEPREKSRGLFFCRIASKFHQRLDALNSKSSPIFALSVRVRITIFSHFCGALRLESTRQTRNLAHMDYRSIDFARAGAWDVAEMAFARYGAISVA